VLDWNAEQTETLLRMQRAGKTRTEIAEHFGVSRVAIACRQSRLIKGMKRKTRDDDKTPYELAYENWVRMTTGARATRLEHEA